VTEAKAAIRAFVALDLPPRLREGLARTIARLEPSVRGIRWMDPKQTHLTLRFLGWTTRERLAALEPRLLSIAEATPAAAVPVSGLGLFPPSGRARVLWIAAHLPAEMTAMQAACEAAAVDCGFPPERRTFQGHLTLGRWREPAARPPLPAVDLGTARLDQLVLFRSELHRSGARYSPLTVFPLR
jgi:2'-5' RNA ligase